MTMWAALCVDRTSHLRCPSLKAHYLQNLDISRWILPELHLPEDQRIGPFGRTLRFIVSLLILFAVLSSFIGDKDRYIYNECNERITCLRYCEEDAFPNLCPTTKESFIYNGNLYSYLFRYNSSSLGSNTHTSYFDYCNTRATLNANFEYATTGSRQMRLHTCFPACRSGTETGFSADSRPLCSSLPASISLQGGFSLTPRNDLLCVDPDDDCEVRRFADETCPDFVNDLCISWSIIWMSIAISNFFQLTVELLVHWTNSIKTIYEPESQALTETDTSAETTERRLDLRASRNKCYGHLAIVLLVFVACFLFVINLVMASYQGRPSAMAFSFLIAWLFDQAKSIVVQPILWWLVDRRCGRVNPLMDLYDPAVIKQFPPEESLMQELRRLVATVMDCKPMTYVVVSIVGGYSVLVLVQLSVNDWIKDIDIVVTVFSGIDTAVLVFFIAEILLRTFAWGTKYLFDPWNFVDSCVVIVSFVLSLLDVVTKGLSVLRILRLVRVMMVVRKVSEGRKKLKKMRRANNGYDVSSQVDKVFEILEDLQGQEAVPKFLKSDIDWMLDIIATGKLYDVSLDKEAASTGNSEVDQWIQQTSVSNDEKKQGDGANGANGADPNKKETKKERKARLKAEKEAKKAEEKAKKLKEEEAEKKKEEEEEEEEDDKDDDEDDLEAGGTRRARFRSQMVMEGPQPQEAKWDDVIHTLTKFDKNDKMGLMDVVKQLDGWQFDVFIYADVTTDQCLPYLGLKLLARYEVFARVEIPMDKLHKYLYKIQQGYSMENPYHSAVHAADVTQAIHYFILAGRLRKHLKDIDLLAAIIGGIVHDYEHPGLSNQFLCRTKHPKAIRYNDMSVLENHHVAASFSLLLKEDYNWIKGLKEADLAEFRKLIISMILATDMTKHFQELGVFKSKLASDDFPSQKIEDRQALLNICLHAADVSNAARSLNLFHKWFDRQMEEFFQQGDLEKQLGLPISPFMDRETTNIEKCQLGFVDVIVQPLFSAMSILIPAVSKDLIEQGIDVNRKHLLGRIEEAQRLYG